MLYANISHLNPFTIGVVFSTLCLILTVIVYLAIPELRGSIYGWFIISSLLSLTIGYTVLAIISLSEYTFPEMTCSLIGKFNGSYQVYLCELVKQAIPQMQNKDIK